MSFYAPAFREKARTQFEQLSPSLQEAVLDAVEQMLLVVSPPAIARRLTPPVVEESDTAATVEGRLYHIFISAELDSHRRRMLLLAIGVVGRADGGDAAQKG